jgi:hypothetical protein
VSILRGLLAAVIVLALAMPAQAQLVRQLPPLAKRGEMTPPQPDGVVTIDGERLTLSAATLIRNTDNVIIPWQRLTEPVRVKYLLDSMGLVHRVWILTPDEIAQPDREPPAAGFLR